ncbi:MAG: tetratricopeptide repeat protein [Candidatus Omnitrophica bacterium]|nr:tetratricopeptide repeat protein [Candidatus Omnitrophota bacterium]
MKKSRIFAIAILLSLLVYLPALAEEHALSSEALFLYGQTLMEKKDYADARHELQKCLMINPQHEEAQALLDSCERQLAPKKDGALKKDVAAKRDEVMLLAFQKAEEKINLQAQEVPPEPEAGPPAKETEPVALSAEEEALAPPVGKGAWTLKKGQKYAELYTKYYWHNHQFTGKGKKRRWDYDGKGNEIRTELKLEYGLTDRFGLMLATVAKEAHWKDSFKSCTRKGFVEMWPGVKYNLFTEPFICTLQARVKFPFDYSEEAVPALGKHQIDEEFKILTAQIWPKLPGYTKFETGYRIRNQEPSDEIPYFFEFGYNPFNWLVLKTTLDCSEGLAPTGDNEDWMKYTVGPIFKISDLLNIEFAYGNTFYGRNTSAAKEVICSVSSQW